MEDDRRNQAEQKQTPETPLAVDLQGIPILNEVVEQDGQEPAGITDPDQNSLPLFNPAASSEPPDRNAAMQALRGELLAVIDQTAAAVAERFRENMEQILKKELTRELDERLLRSLYNEHDDQPE